MKLTAINPATEEIIAEYTAIDFEEAKARSEVCKKAQKTWREVPVEKRASFAAQVAIILRAKSAEYARLMTLEMGKPITQSRAEVEKCAVLCDYYAKFGPSFLAPEMIPTEAKKSYVRFDPLGIVLAIMPWNFPFWQVIRCAIPSLTAGNGVLLKHASNVPGCALALEKLFLEAGYPQGLFTTLLIESATSNRLIETDYIQAVSLTGSTAAGAAVAKTAGGVIKKCVLELGGSDPFIVLADADLDAAARTAVQARTINTGQSCIAAKRFIVEKVVAAEFEEKLVAHFQALVMGDPLDEKTTIGPLAKKDIRDDLQKYLDDARLRGATVRAGGTAYTGKGYFLIPTLLTNVKKEMMVWHEETFGPLMAVMQVESADEALSVANESIYGLGSAVWTRDEKKAALFAEKLEAGFVAINGMVKSDARLPFGGIKKSGFGRELGLHGIREFVNAKTVVG